MTLVKLIKRLVTSSATYAEMTALTGLSHQAVARWVKEMRDEKLIHIAAWERDVRGYPTVPRFAWGHNFTDAVRPSIPRNELERARRQRVKALTQLNESTQ